MKSELQPLKIEDFQAMNTGLVALKKWVEEFKPESMHGEECASCPGLSECKDECEVFKPLLQCAYDDIVGTYSLGVSKYIVENGKLPEDSKLPEIIETFGISKEECIKPLAESIDLMIFFEMHVEPAFFETLENEGFGNYMPYIKEYVMSQRECSCDDCSH